MDNPTSSPVEIQPSGGRCAGDVETEQHAAGGDYYLTFVATEGAASDEALTQMHDAWPAWEQEMTRARVHTGIGRELNHPPHQMTLRVRGGRTLMSDGPFAESKEIVGGFDLLRSDDLETAITVQSGNPVLRFCAFEFRAFKPGFVLGAAAQAFGELDDSKGTPYMLTTWVELADTDAVDADEYERWRKELDDRGVFALGGQMTGPETATTLRYEDGAVHQHSGPFGDTAAFIAGVDVVICASREDAIRIAGTHPAARAHAVEVEAFYSQVPESATD